MTIQVGSLVLIDSSVDKGMYDGSFGLVIDDSYNNENHHWEYDWKVEVFDHSKLRAELWFATDELIATSLIGGVISNG